MWFLDKYGNGINAGQFLSLYVDANQDNPGYYEVKGNNSANSPSGQFATSSTMSETDATALKNRMLDMLGATDLTQ